MIHRHAPTRYNILLTLGLLATLLLPSAAWANPTKSHEAAAQGGSRLRDCHMLNVDLGIGMPYREILHLLPTGPGHIGYVFGATYGYFPLSYGYAMPDGVRVQFAPEGGVRFHLSKKFEFHNHIFSEESMQIPLIANLQINYPATNFMIRSYSGIGCELDVTLSYSLVSSRGSRRDLLNDLKGLSRFSGSIFFIGKFIFRKGIFISSKIKLPFRIFSIRSDLRTIRNLKKNDDIDEESVNILRACNASLAELCLGIDIMELF